LAKLQAAKAELEAEARQQAEEKKAAVEARIADRHEQEERTGKKIRGAEPKAPDPDTAAPEAQAQRNFTDPESRIMPSGSQKDAFVQGYNAQIAVDGAAQIIVAVDVIQQTTDNHQLAPMLEQTERNVGAWPQAASADTGYWSAARSRGSSWIEAGVIWIDDRTSAFQIPDSKSGSPSCESNGDPPGRGLRSDEFAGVQRHLAYSGEVGRRRSEATLVESYSIQVAHMSQEKGK
jgi:hypothetical protein